jgi:hypothetical protein
VLRAIGVKLVRKAASATGGLSMTSYILGADCPAPTGEPAAAELPDVAPPEQANVCDGSKVVLLLALLSFAA